MNGELFNKTDKDLPPKNSSEKAWLKAEELISESPEKAKEMTEGRFGDRFREEKIKEAREEGKLGKKEEEIRSGSGLELGKGIEGKKVFSEIGERGGEKEIEELLKLVKRRRVMEAISLAKKTDPFLEKKFYINLIKYLDGLEK